MYKIMYKNIRNRILNSTLISPLSFSVVLTNHAVNFNSIKNLVINIKRELSRVRLKSVPIVEAREKCYY